MKAPMVALLTGVVRLYQWCISPMLGQTCRFYPSCSNYALEALRMHGALKGSWLAAKRVGKCHPWHAGGLDPVPPAAETHPTGHDHHLPACGCKHS